ncbi:MAG: acyl-CoA dehydratase activase-related protein [Bacillota bacterium]|nr:acyl-CoA dehydratase activase-related protein [Bacillota bacterium]
MPVKITFPHAGEYYVVFKDLMTNLGFEVVVPPPTSQRTLDLGVKYAPAQACLPFKITLGNLIEGIEKGADVVGMIGGKTGICRLAYYSEMYQKILADNGYSVDLLAVKVKKEFWDNLKKHQPELTFRQFIKTIRSFWRKLILFELIREKSLELRPYEVKKGDCTRIKRSFLQELEQTTDLSALKALRHKIIKGFASIPIDENRKVIKIGLVGEFFLLIDQFSTMNMEEFLGNNGILLKYSLSFSEFFIGSLKQKRFLDKYLPTHNHKVYQFAKEYITRPIGGHGRETIGEAVVFRQKGYDGVIHLYPFSCMPEVVAGSITSKVSVDWQIPILSICMDEHTGQAGFQTRLEAFTDMIKRKKFMPPQNENDIVHLEVSQ